MAALAVGVVVACCPLQANSLSGLKMAGMKGQPCFCPLDALRDDLDRRGISSLKFLLAGIEFMPDFVIRARQRNTYHIGFFKRQPNFREQHRILHAHKSARDLAP